ncbi:hypothetical protein Scep_004356 [Stephania cephalantha]|uniref:Uncharacterized protein n=1 Tax=Stephania cephalantha TaxID=152367 RepID=A0AAP0KSA8_9MAGN
MERRERERESRREGRPRGGGSARSEQPSSAHGGRDGRRRSAPATSGGASQAAGSAAIGSRDRGGGHIGARHRPADGGCAAARGGRDAAARPRTMAGGEQRPTQQRRRAAGRQRRDRIRDDDGQRRPIGTGERGGPAGAWRWLRGCAAGLTARCAVEMRSSGGRRARAAAAAGGGRRWPAAELSGSRRGSGGATKDDVGVSAEQMMSTRAVNDAMALSDRRRRESTNVDDAIEVSGLAVLSAGAGPYSERKWGTH